MLTAVICSLTFITALTVGTASPVFANSGPPYEEGITPTGIHSVHENSVLQVVSEKLTFKLGTPLNELKDGEQYDSTVTAEYEFYNPTDETVTTKMAFPISTGNYYTGNAAKDINPSITVNGESVQYEVRHTYGTYNDFSEDVLKIKDGYISTDFFSPDLPVTEYIFRANLPDNYNRAEFRVKMPESSATRYFCNSDDGVYFSYTAYNGFKFSVYVLGEDIDISALDWVAYRYNESVGRNVAVDGSVTFVKKSEPVTFKEYVLKSYDSMSDISEVDWYNAMFDIVKKDGLCAGSGETPQYYSFTEWYVYETTVAAKSGFTNAVTAAMYPTVYYSYSPYVYEYNYYLSPAKNWASFGNLTVEVETSLYMQENDYYNPSDTENSVFKKTETGYAASFTGLPNGEFQFKMCSAETPSASTIDTIESFGKEISLTFFIVFLVIIGAALIAGLVILTVFLVKRGRRKKRLAAADKANTEALTENNPSDGEDGSTGGACASDLPDADIIGEADGLTVPETVKEKPSYCIRCGKQIRQSSAFCPYCGSAVAKDKVSPKVQRAPSAPEGEVKRINGLGIAGFIVAIISVVFVELETLLFIFSAVGFGLSLAGVLLKKKYRGVYGLAIAGLVISSVMLLIAIISMPFYMMGIIW